MKTKEGELKGGNWIPRASNPKGFNRYKKNPNPVEEKKNQLEEFMELPESTQKETIAKLGNDIYRLTREIRPMMLKFKKFKDYYDKKHFGWKWED